MKRLIPVLLLIAPAFAQMPVSFFPTQLKDYLGLTDALAASITKLNSDYTSFNMQKQSRIAQVQRELVVETAKDQLDPMALGLRYVELETIRRELNDQLKKTRTAAVALLNDAQKLKLKALEDAMKLQPTITQAQCENLLDQMPFPGNIIPASRITPVIRTGDFSGVIGGVLIPGVACGASFIQGNFSPMP
jgi:hypothetical protein